MCWRDPKWFQFFQFQIKAINHKFIFFFSSDPIYDSIQISTIIVEHKRQVVQVLSFLGFIPTQSQNLHHGMGVFLFMDSFEQFEVLYLRIETKSVGATDILIFFTLGWGGLKNLLVIKFTMPLQKLPSLNL